MEITVQDWLGEDNKIGIDIWEKKYRYENESFDEWLDRVSGGNEEVRELTEDKKFLFAGRILSNRGLQEYRKVTYSNCYVLSPPDDNIESIFDTAKKLARTFSYGGGVGIDLSNLAPRGAKINNTAKETTGAVSFMDLYSMVTGLIGQEGRRGALMLSIDCSHPDLEEFIEIKSDLDKVVNANISIRVDDDFMKAVENNKEYDLKYIREETGEVLIKTVNANAVFNKFAKMNWDYAEPAMLYWDRIKNWSLLSDYENFEFAGVNPCAEEPLPAGGSCLLGSINLAEFVTENKIFNYIEFKYAVGVAVKALNEVLDEGLNLHPLKEQRDSVRDWRQIGLGVMGFADMLIKLGIEYGSQESVLLAEKIGETMLISAMRQSNILAQLYGAFPKHDYNYLSKSEFYKRHIIYDKVSLDALIKKYGLRNSQLLTIAPTGTLSTMLGVSGGIEPIYATFYNRITKSLHGADYSYKVYTPIVKEYMDKNGISDEKDLPDYFVTAMGIGYKNRIEIQSAWQHYIDASISSTVNVPNSFTIEEVKDLYMYAWKYNLKGITLYRDGCKRSGILSVEEIDTTDDDYEQELPRGLVLEVSDDVIGKKRKLNTGCGSLHCTAFFDPITGELQETYLSKGSTGGCNNFMVGLSRMISLSARAGVDIDVIIDQLNSTGACPSYAVRKATKGDTSKGACCPMAIGNVLKEMYLETRNDLGFDVDEPIDEVDNAMEILNEKVNCPKCGAELQFSGGCNSCPDCGYSKCD